MTFDIFDRLTETTGYPCTSDVFYNIADGDKVTRIWKQCQEAAAQGDKESLGGLKRKLPFITWQASFMEHRRSNANALPSGLFMLDVDKVENMDDFRQNIVAPAIANAAQLGIVAIHLTPSQHGFHFIAKCPQGVTTLEGCQRWLTAQLGIMIYDETCKDFARGSFAVPLEAYLYLDNKGLWEDEPLNVLPSLPLTPPEGGETSGKGSLPVREGMGVGCQQRTFSEEQKSFKYRDHLISDIAAKWVAKHGEPQAGERHTYYYKLCNMFRYITDGDVGIMLAQLPDFGLGIAEREKEAEHACRRAMGTQIPYTFYKFLVDAGVIDAAKPTEAKEVVQEVTDYVPFSATDGLPSLPPVFREFCANCPADFVYPTIVALLPVLGTLATRLRARYLDGREHTTSFIGVIFAPQSAGKSFARDIVQTLTPDLRRHDEISVLKEKQYKAELKMKKNSDHLPEDPHAPYRIVQAVISVPRLLQRQEDAGGLHQLSFVEEIDTLTKSNAGGSYAQKSDLYRQAFDNAEYGQDYISVDTFTGSVKLFYNILMLGTPKQLYKFFNDTENGLVSRCAFAEITNQEFAEIPYFKPLTKMQQEAITRVLNRFEAMTYQRKNTQSDEYVIQPTVDVDELMKPVKEALKKWLEQTRLAALKDNNTALDIFRRRAAVKAFRLGMICMALYEKKTLKKKEVIQRICKFVTWFAQRDAEQSTATFGQLMNEAATAATQQRDEQPLIDMLPETF
ncbi:MAG: DUF3987 domain-containing protein, partial [Bacteroidaceae bacterium]|nr:DUF3987 domain-containing protein [Bacteroidaceae bacterium]